MNEQQLRAALDNNPDIVAWEEARRYADTMDRTTVDLNAMVKTDKGVRVKTITYYIRGNEAYYKEGHDPAPAAPGFMDQLREVEAQLKALGHTIGVIEKQVSQVGNSAIVEAKIPDPEAPDDRLKDYEIQFFVSELNGEIVWSPYRDEDKVKHQEVLTKREGA